MNVGMSRIAIGCKFYKEGTDYRKATKGLGETAAAVKYEK